MQLTQVRGKQAFNIEAAPHLRSAMSTKKTMLYTFLALIPGFILTIYFFGYGVWWQFLISLCTAVFCELLVGFLRKRRLRLFLSDLSYLVTAMLLALTLPPLLPWYLTVIATAFAILIVKHCFGGLGMNIFNPAMAGFVFMMVSLPSVFYSTYLTPNLEGHAIATLDKTSHIIFAQDDSATLITKMKQAGDRVDLISGATYLESVKTSRKSGNTTIIEPIDYQSDSFIAYLCIAIAYAVGGLILALWRIILITMPLCFMATIFAAGYLWYYLDPSSSIAPLDHLLFGGTMLAAFFIITDPVTNAGTSKGRIVFSIFTALLVLIIRVEGSYSDSVAFAVLLANACAPLIDVLTRRRAFGVGYKDGDIV